MPAISATVHINAIVPQPNSFDKVPDTIPEIPAPKYIEKSRNPAIEDVM